ncbi:3-dehydrosphinganine reductase TSC10A [Abeliophyllum distichum]|uniref:3-dehydrosphinganine reductase n=1 Tax=Abeliophyllum distichum TaxID=126358 RepID=A0ABD1Q440_9LAMI
MADAYFSLLSLILVLPLSLLILLYFIVRPRPVRIPIKNRHVFITGGSSGIGLALAHQCAQQGADVTLLARNVSKLEEAKESIKLATGRDVRIFSADVREYESIVKVVEEVGEIDVLVCNHGVYVPQELESQELEEIRFMIDVNLMGTFHLIKAALPGMKKNRAERGPGSIAIMSSQAGQVGIYGYTAYSASKFGLRGMAEALQQEIIADNIHVSLIFPPDTETPGFVEENKRRPQLTSIIAASSGAMKADEVAKKSIDGIKSGTFIVPCNFEGFLLSVATAGLCPQRSFLMAFVEHREVVCTKEIVGNQKFGCAVRCSRRIWDHAGSIVAACSKLVDGSFSTEDAEGLALRQGLRLIKTSDCALQLWSALGGEIPPFASWRSSLEDAFLWIGGWWPSMTFHLLYSKSGLQLEARLAEFIRGLSTGDLGDLSPCQLQLVNELQKNTIMKEKDSTEKYAKLQETS